MALFLEDTKEVTKKQIPIPQNAKKIFKAMKKIYDPYLDKPIKGAKILKSLASDKEYNTKGIEDKTSLKNNTTVSVEDAKKRLERQNKLAPNSIEYQLYGGQIAHDILKNGIERSRSVQKVDKVKPPKPTANAATKPSKTSKKEIQVPNGKITYNESREIMKENMNDSHIFYKYLEEYGVEYVMDEFVSNPNGKQSWTPLINPNMYAKALKEFSRFGKLTNSAFPSRYVYQWMGIIMRNTAKLIANTSLAGHSQWLPIDEIESYIPKLIGHGKDYEIIGYDEIKYEISRKELLELCDEKGIYTDLQEANGIHRNGQYDLFMNQDEVDSYDEKKERLSFIRQNQENMRQIAILVDKINQRLYNHEGKIEINYDNCKIYRVMDIIELLDIKGLYNWMQMPDGSDAFSDFGIEPLTKIIYEYDESLPPEKVLVIVNKALDMYHQRGDMASIFIQGGSKALSQISENIKRKNRKKIYISESQLPTIKKQLNKK